MICDEIPQVTTYPISRYCCVRSCPPLGYPDTAKVYARSWTLNKYAIYGWYGKSIATLVPSGECANRTVYSTAPSISLINRTMDSCLSSHEIFASHADTKCQLYWHLARYVKLWVAHAPRMPGTFSQPSRLSYTDMHHGTCVTHVSWCMPGSLINGFLWSRSRGKFSRQPTILRI